MANTNKQLKMSLAVAGRRHSLRLGSGPMQEQKNRRKGYTGSHRDDRRTMPGPMYLIASYLPFDACRTKRQMNIRLVSRMSHKFPHPLKINMFILRFHRDQVRIKPISMDG